MKVVLLTTDNRWIHNEYARPEPTFGPAPEAIIAGLAATPGIELHIVSCVRHPVACPPKLADNIWFHSVLVPKIGWMRTFYLGCIRATRRRIRAINPDIVHGQGTEHENGLSAVFSGYPNVVTIHGIMQEQAQLLQARPGSFYWLANRLENVTLRRTAGVFCNSRYTEEHIRPRARQTWRVANPLRLPFFDAPAGAAPVGEPIFLNIGLVCPRKRQVELLEMARGLHAAGLRFKLHFLGKALADDPYGARFLKLVEQYREFAVHVGVKSLPEVIQALDTSSALVHVPAEETFGLVVAEALARNVNVFGFEVGGVADICAGVPGANLFPDGDWPGLSAGLAKRISAGPGTSLGADAIMRERYHPTVIGRRHREIYQEVLGQKK